MSPTPTRLIFSMPDGLRLGGVYVWSTRMARKLRQYGLDTMVVDHPRPNAVGRLDEKLAYRDDGDVLVRGPMLSDFQLSGRELAFYRAAAPAVVLPNYRPEVFQACARLLRRGDVPLRVIAFQHSDYEPFYAEHAYFEPIIHRFVAVSRDCEEGLARVLPPHRHKDIVLRPYPVVGFRGERPSRRPQAPLSLLYAGRLDVRQKRLFDIPPILAELARRGIAFSLTVAGDGPQKDEILAALAPFGERVTFRGPVPHHEMPSLYLAHDVFLLPTNYEGTSIALLEATAHGCVPVVSDVSGMRGVIEDGVNGWIAPIGDTKAMAEAIASLAARPEGLQAMAEKARAVAVRYDPDAYAAWLTRLVEEVATEPLRRWPAGRAHLQPNPEHDGWRRRVAGLPGLFALKQTLFGSRRVF